MLKCFLQSIYCLLTILLDAKCRMKINVKSLLVDIVKVVLIINLCIFLIGILGELVLVFIMEREFLLLDGIFYFDKSTPLAYPDLVAMIKLQRAWLVAHMITSYILSGVILGMYTKNWSWMVYYLVAAINVVVEILYGGREASLYYFTYHVAVLISVTELVAPVIGLLAGVAIYKKFMFRPDELSMR